MHVFTVTSAKSKNELYWLILCCPTDVEVTLVVDAVVSVAPHCMIK